MQYEASKTHEMLGEVHTEGIPGEAYAIEGTDMEGDACSIEGRWGEI